MRDRRSIFRSLIPAVVIASALGSGAGCDDETVGPDHDITPDRHHSMLALGDSYTLGEGVPSHLCWPHQLADSLATHGDTLEVTMIAGTGWTSGDLRLHSIHAPDVLFDLVTVMIGANDVFTGLAGGVYSSNLDSVLAGAVAASGGRPDRIVVFSIPDFGVTPYGEMFGGEAMSTAVDSFNVLAAEVTAAHGALWCDITTESRLAADRPDLVARDGLHFSPAMYARWVGIAGPVLREVLASR